MSAKPPLLTSRNGNRLPALEPSGAVCDGGAANQKPQNGKHAAPVKSGPETTPPTPEPDRDKQGRFQVGNKASRGNPFSRKLANMRQAFLDSTGPEDVQILARKLHALAVAGDTQAAKLWLEYAIGKPKDAKNPDALDLELWQQIVAWPTVAEILRAMLDTAAEPGMAADIMDQTVPPQKEGVWARMFDKKNARSYGTMQTIIEERRVRTKRKV